MLATLAIVGLALAWLGCETDWMTVRLPVGALQRFTPILCRNCNLSCHYRSHDHWMQWDLPARTVKVFSSTINFKAGCNLYRAKLLKDIATKQRRKAPATYKKPNNGSYFYNGKYRKEWFNTVFEPTLDLFIDGELKFSVNGDFKRGVIKRALQPYTTKVRVGHQACIIAVGEADRVR